ncbi:hypothetical protein B0H34DRAFT_75557 [Crassisporium funariophilum]|nr:hypothetical protein B0H34DRAFT_75557 [Crassisporium funariophilum]
MLAVLWRTSKHVYASFLDLANASRAIVVKTKCRKSCRLDASVDFIGRYRVHVTPNPTCLKVQPVVVWRTFLLVLQQCHNEETLTDIMLKDCNETKFYFAQRKTFLGRSTILGIIVDSPSIPDQIDDFSRCQIQRVESNSTFSRTTRTYEGTEKRAYGQVSV